MFDPIRTAILAVAILLLAFAGLTVNGWRLDSNALEATEKKLKTAQQKLENEIDCNQWSNCWRAKLDERDRVLRDAEEAIQAQQKLAKEIEDDLQAKLADVDKRYLAATERLSRLRVCKPVPSASTPPPAAGEPRPPGPSDQSNGASLAGLGPVLRDCELDATDYDALTQWYARLREIRNAETNHGR